MRAFFKRNSTCVVVLLALGLADAAGAADIELNGQTFHLPEGFTIEQVAGPPLVDRPICADFDQQGRLYVADSSGSNDPLEQQLEQKPHRIVRLEDSDGDGRFESSTVFADRMMFPEGTLWYDGSLYVSAPPSIWKLTDTDDDGVADRREEWFAGKTLTHCGNDLHGPYLGPDGWFYWCKGAYAQQTYQRPGKSPFVTKAAHIFRCRPDAPRDPVTGSVLTSAIEPVMTGGMANPVDVTFTRGGERIFTTTFLVRPSVGLRDGLIHAIYGGVYGSRLSSIEGHPRTGELMPVLLHMGPAAPCGLTTYRSSVLGADFRDNLFACLFNLHKVTRHALAPRGATFETRDEDFVVSDNLDFHPTDVLEDADGSLLIVDTGGWFKLCCPTSQLWKPDVLGAIYRVRRIGAPTIDDPRGASLQWSTMTTSQLTDLLSDQRPALQRRAIAELARRGAAAVQSLSHTAGSAEDTQARLGAIWALTRIDGSAARAAVRRALTDSDETVRQAAIHSASLWRDGDATARLIELLESGSDHNRRAAAEALGRIGRAEATAALLAAAGRPNDRTLEHSLIYALIEIADPQATRKGLTELNPPARRCAIIALDQMEGGDLQAADVVPLLAADDPLLRETAAWVVEHRLEWGVALLGYFERQLTGTKLSPQDRSDLERRLARFAVDSPVQQFLAASLQDDRLSRDATASVLRAMRQCDLKELPSIWMAGLTRQLYQADANLVQEAISVARNLRPPRQGTDDLVTALLEVGRRQSESAAMRLQALAALPGGLRRVDPPLFAFLGRHLDGELPFAARAAAAEVLAKARLDTDQQIALARRFEAINPLDIEALLQGFQRFSDERVGLALLAALERSPARSALRVETLRPRLAKFPPTVRQRAEKLYELLSADRAQQQARLEQLLSSLPPGEAHRGQTVFRSAKASCSACHAIGYLGGKTGPDLTRIARIRNRRDLLEAIVFPSASLVRSYEPIAVATVDGHIHNGLVLSDTSAGLVLATGPDKQVRIAQNEIEEKRQSTISIMPAGLDQQLTLQQLADLVEFLLKAK